MSAHQLVLTIHVISSAVALGATVSYAVWIRLAEADPAHVAFTIRAVRRSDRLVAIPSFLAAGLSGAWLVRDAAPSLLGPWLVLSLAIYLAVLAVGFIVFGPVVRREIAALERGGASDPAYRVLRRQAQLLSWGTVAALVVIAGLMVVKPG